MSAVSVPPTSLVMSEGPRFHSPQRAAVPAAHPHLNCVRQPPSAFTLLELMTVLVVISILAVMSLPLFSSFQGRAQKVKCIGNLRSIHTATNLYMHDNKVWPQLPLATYGNTAAAQAWIDAMKPYGLQAINWICPSIQQALHSPDISNPANTRIDYVGSTFNTKPNAPFSQPRQPWYIETSDIHGNGQEILFPDGHIEEAGDIIHAKH